MMGLGIEVRPQRGAACGTVLLLAALTLCVGSIATPGVAGAEGDEDFDTRLEHLRTSVKADKAAGRIAALEGAVRVAKELYDAAGDDEKRRKAVIGVIGSITTGTKNDDVVIAGLKGLRKLGDPLGAKYVRRHLKQRDVKASSRVLEAAVASAGEVVDKSLVAPLMKIVMRSKTYGVAASAVKSLGQYGRIKSKRVKILVEVVDSVRKNRSGGASRHRGGSNDPDYQPLPGRSGGAAARWAALAPVVPRAMSQLTGQEIHSIDDWFQIVKDSKNRLGNLFVLEDGS